MMYAIVLVAIILAGWAEPKRLVYSCDAAAVLLTPPRPLLGYYEVCTTPASLETVLGDAGPQGVRYGPVETGDPLDALGTAGTYDRSLVARLYGGRRARVAHGWMAGDHGVVSITLISPYPDRTLTVLVSGTLVIRYVVENPGAIIR